jgi:protein-S-isoprenylcysteine O-methyltransferase Ste14
MATPAGERSAGEIVQDVVHDFGEIVRAEIRLARNEIAEKAQSARRAARWLEAAAVCGVVCVACLAAACVSALAQTMPLWLASLLTALLLLCVGAGMYAAGRSRLRQVNPVPERTAQSVKESLEWLKQHTK